MEAGCGVVPFKYVRRQFVHSLQWAIGLELFLKVDDPSRVFLTTDHPNGGPFTTYPHLIGLLCDRSLRSTALAEIHADAAASSDLSGLDREYSIAEIATMTRSAPAAILGLSDRGNLVSGAVADVVVYENKASIEAMFERPRHVFRRGRLLSPGVAPEPTFPSTTLKAAVSFDAKNVAKFAARYQPAATMAMQRLWISDEEMAGPIGSVPTISGAAK